MARCFIPAPSEPCASTTETMTEPYKPYEPNLDRINDAEQMRREREEQLRAEQERIRQQEQARQRQQEQERLRLLQEQQRSQSMRP